MDSRPDLILIMTDQQRHDQVGFARGSGFETPNLDALARRGVIFDTAYSSSTVCIPARISLMTGLGAHRVPSQPGSWYLEEGFWTLARELSRAGYETALIGKMHFRPIRAQHGFETMRMCEHLGPAELAPASAPDGRPDVDDYHRWLVAQGVVDWRATEFRRAAPGQPRPPRFALDASLHPTSWIEREATAFLEKRDPTRPLFLVVSFPHPHPPLNPPTPYESMYDPADSQVPTDGFEANDGLPRSFVEPLTVQTGPYRPSRVTSERGLREMLAVVRGLVRQIDDSTGRILSRVDLDRSVVCFTSDHGDYAGHRGMLRKVPWIPFDDLARVPLVFAAPDAVGGRRRSDLVQSMDWVLTALDYAGVLVDTELFESRSLRPLLTDPDAPVDTDRHVIAAVSNGWPTIRRRNLKLITRRHFTLPGHALFDLDADPGETVDLGADPDHASEVAELTDLLERSVWIPRPDLPRVSPSFAPASS